MRLQVKRQLAGGEALEQRQHVASAFRVDEEVRVLDAGRDALDRDQLAEVEAIEPARELRRRTGVKTAIAIPAVGPARACARPRG